MPTKTGHGRPQAGHGLGAAMTREQIKTKAEGSRVKGAKVARNRNRVVPKKPATHGGRK
jgi:hypothetical protein